MQIYIDESGSFVDAKNEGSWNCVLAYVAPSSDIRKAKIAIRDLKLRSGYKKNDEIKLHQIKDIDYFQFLSDLGKLNGVIFAIATDSGKNNDKDITVHQKKQSDAVLINLPRMKYKGGRDAVQLLGNQLLKLPSQLYAQLWCQVILIHEITTQGILYFVQRFPQSLGKFKWRIDQKNSSKIDFEDAFEKITPMLIQSFTIDKTAVFLEGADYSALKKYSFENGKVPTYLKDEYGIDFSSTNKINININKLVRDDLDFVDSKVSKGIQIADLLSSGIRRCLRNGFRNCNLAAILLGKLMVQKPNKQTPLTLVGFKEETVDDTSHYYKVEQIMYKNCREMVAPK